MLCEVGDSLGEHSDRLYDLQPLVPKTVVLLVAAVISEAEELQVQVQVQVQVSVQMSVPVPVSSMLEHMCLAPTIPHCDACICSCLRNVQ